MQESNVVKPDKHIVLKVVMAFFDNVGRGSCFPKDIFWILTYSFDALSPAAVFLKTAFGRSH